MKLIVAELPAAWRVMPPLVVDCNLLAALLFHEEQRAEAEARLVDRDIRAPTLLDYEMASVALKKARSGGASVAVAGLTRYAALSIRLHSIDIDEVLGIAGRYELSAYDASYLWLAADIRAPLATFDPKLGNAAIRHLGSLQ